MKMITLTLPAAEAAMLQEIKKVKPKYKILEKKIFDAIRYEYNEIKDKKEKKSIVYRDEILETELVLRESTKKSVF